MGCGCCRVVDSLFLFLQDSWNSRQWLIELDPCCLVRLEVVCVAAAALIAESSSVEDSTSKKEKPADNDVESREEEEWSDQSDENCEEVSKDSTTGKTSFDVVILSDDEDQAG